MKKQRGFSVIELLVVVVILGILTALTVISLNPNRRQIKTDDAAGAVYNIMRQARIQAVTGRKFYGVVINASNSPQSLTLSNSNQNRSYLPQSITLIDMGEVNGPTALTDDKPTFTKVLPADIIINAGFFPTTNNTDFPVPEKTFTKYDFSTGPYVIYFDPAGRAVNAANGTGTQSFSTFYFSSFDIDLTKSSTLLRAITLYGSTGGLKFWRYLPTGAPTKWSPKINPNT